MKTDGFDELIERFVLARKAINDKALEFAGIEVYSPVAMPRPVARYPELDFLKALSWVYMHHIEAGGVSVRYLVRFLDGYSLDGDRRGRNHLDILVKLRTEMQHNLVNRSEGDKRTMLACRNWYFETCSTWAPSEDDHWTVCGVRLLEDANALISSLDSALRRLATDDESSGYRETWLKRVSRDHRPNEFDEVIEKVKIDLGRNELDGVAFRKRYFDRWKAQLELLVEDYRFEEEARRLVETSIITETTATPPITGADLMTEFHLAPGPEVGRLRRIAQEIYNAEPCPRGELMRRIRVRVSESAVPGIESQPGQASGGGER